MTDPMGAGTVGRHVAEAFVRAREAMRPHDAAHADKRLTGWLDRFEGDMRDALAPHLAQWADDPDTPAEVADLFRTLTAPEHATQSGLLFAAVGALVYPLVSAVMTGPTALVEQRSLEKFLPAPLTPAEIALGAVRNTLGNIDRHAEAARSGLDAQRLDVMALNTGDSISIGDALLLYRRGQMDLATLQHAVRQSRVRDEWFDDILKLRYVPPPAGEVIVGAIKNHLADADARAKLGEAGIDPANFDWMRASAGRPPGTHEMLDLWNRGEATEADVDDAVHQSDINDHFLPFVKQLRWYLPPVRSVVAMLRSGAVDEAHGRRLLQQNGVRAADIDGYVAEATHGRTQTTKELTQAQIVRLYSNGLLTRPIATTRLTALGYPAGDVTLILDLADGVRHERYVAAVITRAHTLYVSHKIDRPHVVTMLTADGVTSEGIAEYLKLWDLERDANVHTITVPGIMAAYRRKILGPVHTRERLVAAGVAVDDLPIVIADAYPASTKTVDITAAITDILGP